MTPARARMIFRQEKAFFVKLFPHLKDIEFVFLDQRCTSLRHCRFRDVAFADPDNRHIGMLLRALKLSQSNIRGLIRHEFGHLADSDPERPWREQRADDIAEWVTGQKIRYDENLIETVGRGAYPRPLSLHR